MASARRIYERVGFVRDESRDLFFEPDVELLSYMLVLTPVSSEG